MPQTSIRQSRSGAYAGQIAEEMCPMHIRTGIVATGKTVKPGQPTIITGKGPNGEDVVRPIENGDTITAANFGGFVRLDTFRENENGAGYGAGRTVSLMREGVMYLETSAAVTFGNPVFVGVATAQLEDIDDAAGTGLAQAPGCQFLESVGSAGLVRTKVDIGIAAADAVGAIQKSLGTTAGDIIYFTGAGEPARLAIGTTGQVLTVGAGGVPEWATA